MIEKNYDIKPLSSDDKKNLRKQYAVAIGFIMVTNAIFFFIYKFVIKPDKFSAITIVMFTLFLALFLGIFAYLLWSTYIDLKRGIKHCYTGVVTDKRIDKHSTTTKRHHTKSGNFSSRTSTKTYYKLTINAIEHNVTYKEYSQVVVGDRAYLEVSPKAKEVLTFTVLEKKGETILFKERVTNPIPTKTVSKPMHPEEIALVKKIFFKHLKKKLFFLIALIVLLLILWQGIFIFLIPLLVAFIYFAFNILIQINTYTKFNRNGKLKNIITVQVHDKLKITSNKHATKFRLITNFENVDVSEKIYNQIKAKDIIKLHNAIFLNYIVGISFDDGINYILNQ